MGVGHSSYMHGFIQWSKFTPLWLFGFGSSSGKWLHTQISVSVCEHPEFQHKNILLPSPSPPPPHPAPLHFWAHDRTVLAIMGFVKFFLCLPFCSDAQDSACMLLRAFNVISTKCSESVATASNVHVHMAVRAAWCFGRWIFHSCAVSNPSLYIRYNTDLISQLISQIVVRGPMFFSSSVFNYF